MRSAECGVRSAECGVVRDYGASFDNTGRQVRIGWNNARPVSWTTPWSNAKVSPTSRPTQRPREANGS
jgi:hypothetical protein